MVGFVGAPKCETVLSKTPAQLILIFGFLSAILNVTESLEIKQLKSYRFYEAAEETMIA